MIPQPVEILLVEDNPGDITMTARNLKHAKVLNHLTVVEDGEEALAYLHRRGPFSSAIRPDLILLDLNLPRMSGAELLADIKSDTELRLIPVVVLTSSAAEEDIIRAYGLHANCYITKPVDFEEMNKVVKSIDDFWFSVVKLPPRRLLS
jgi:chemotaxis family two-component system response regulator Rcp1